MDSVVAAVAEVLVAVVGQAPAFLVAGLLLVFFVANWARISALIDRIRKVGIRGVELELATEDLKRAKPAAPVPQAEAADIERRFLAAAEAVSLTRILWVDDKPQHNRLERRFLRSAGATVVNALSTDEALEALRRDDYDIVITDRSRPESPEAGLELAETIALEGPGIPVIGYTGSETAHTPAHFFGMTSRPGRLMRLVLAAVEARR